MKCGYRRMGAFVCHTFPIDNTQYHMSAGNSLAPSSQYPIFHIPICFSNSPNGRYPIFTCPHAFPTLTAANVPYSYSHMPDELRSVHNIPYSHVHMHFPLSQQPTSHVHKPICLMKSHQYTTSHIHISTFPLSQQPMSHIPHFHPPKNGKIALWPNSRVVKCKCTFRKCQKSTIRRTFGTIFWTFLIL